MADMDLEKQATKRKRNEVNYEEGYGEEHGEEYEDEYGEDDEEDYGDPDQGEFEEGQSDEMIVRPTIPAPEGMRGDTARYDSYTSNFFHMVTIEHHDAFKLCTMTIPDGSLAGRKVLILEPIQTFTFFDLPIELRLAIYEYVFPQGKAPIKVLSKKEKTRHAKGRPGVRFVHQKYDGDRHGGSIDTAAVEAKLKINYPTGSLSPLLVSKEMFNEAAPVLYANTCFEYRARDFDLGGFLSSLGSMRKHITNMDLGDSEHVPLWSHGRESIADCENLRSIEIDHKVVCKVARGEGIGNVELREGVEQFVQSMIMLLKCMYEGRPANAKDSVYNVIRVSSKPCRRKHTHRSLPTLRQCDYQEKGCGVKCGDSMKLHCEELEAAISGLLAEKLGEDEPAAEKSEEDLTSPADIEGGRGLHVRARKKRRQ